MTTQVIVPRGTNIGKAIKNHLINSRLYKYIDVKNIEVRRDRVNKVNIAVVNYKHKTN